MLQFCHMAGGRQCVHVVVHGTVFLREYESQIRQELCKEGSNLLAPIVPRFT